MTKRISYCLDEIKKGLSRFNVLDDETIKSFGTLLKIIKHIDIVREAGYEKYLMSFTA